MIASCSTLPQLVANIKPAATEGLRAQAAFNGHFQEFLRHTGQCYLSRHNKKQKWMYSGAITDKV